MVAPLYLLLNHPRERISEFVDYHLNPEAPKLPSYINDTTHFLNKLYSLKDIPVDATVVTLDVPSLYTNIPHSDGIQACRETLNKRKDKTIPT